LPSLLRTLLALTSSASLLFAGEQVWSANLHADDLSRTLPFSGGRVSGARPQSLSNDAAASKQEGGVYRIAGDVSAPILIDKVEPDYSEEAYKANYSGTVLLSIVVDDHGVPRDIHIIRPLGMGLDEKAIEAVMKWRFRPGMKGGEPVATQAQVEVNFRLLHDSTRKYRDRGEYDLYSTIARTQDDRERLRLLNSWEAKYPDSDFKHDRLEYFIASLGKLAITDSGRERDLIDKCEEMLRDDAKYFTAMYYVSLYGPQLGGTGKDAELIVEVKSAAHGLLDNADDVFAVSKKKPRMSDAEWAKAKDAVIQIANNALAWAGDKSKRSSVDGTIGDRARSERSRNVQFQHQKRNGADYDLRVQITQTQWNTSPYGASGFGYGNLLSAEGNHGFTFTFACSRPFLPSQGSGYYPARWKKEGLKLVISTTEIGNPNKHESCELKVALQPFAYEVRNSAIVAVPR
jgi:TonB family protein